MSGIPTLKGVPGILRPFKEYLEKNQFVRGDQVVYYGVPGTCTPFIELLAFTVRGLGLDQVFVPYFNEKMARNIVFTEGIGMQISSDQASLSPRALVVMGGLAMPNVPVTVDDARSVIEDHKETTVIGVCFMSMFEKASWTNEIRFDLLIDATIDPVTIAIRTTGQS